MWYCLLQYTVYYVYAVCCDVTHGSVVEIRKCDLLSASCEVHVPVLSTLSLWCCSLCDMLGNRILFFYFISFYFIFFEVPP